MNPLLRHLELRPHGDSLLTSSAAFWLFSARALIVVMCLSEAIAWGRLGYVFGERSIGWIAAGVVSLIIVVVVWMIDVSLITMDRAWRDHAAALLGYKSNGRGRAMRTTLTVVLRIGLLFGSLYITAPYLAQLVFYKDIQRFIDAEAVANIDQARKTFVASRDAAISAKAAEIAERRFSLEKEVAGGGISRRYGFGPTARTIRVELAKQEMELQQLRTEQTETLRTYDTLARDWRTNRDVLAASYNVKLPQTSILENSRALDALRQQPHYQGTELAVKGFLAFVFSGLLLLKLFEPISIRLYLSEVLQQEYVRYLAGTFDGMLPDTERSTVRPSPMTPQRLYDFLANEWSRDHYVRAEQDRSVALVRALTRGVAEFETSRTRLTEDVRTAEESYHNACAAAEDCRQSLTELDSALQIVGAARKDFADQLTRWRTEGEALTDHHSRLHHLKLSDQIRQQLTEANQLLDRLHEQKPKEEKRLQRARSDQQYWYSEVTRRREELTTVSRRISDLRRQATETELNIGTVAVH
jgi:hypothetical protein